MERNNVELQARITQHLQHVQNIEKTHAKVVKQKEHTIAMLQARIAQMKQQPFVNYRKYKVQHHESNRINQHKNHIKIKKDFKDFNNYINQKYGESCF